MTVLTFFIGVHQVCDVHKVDYACVSLNRLIGRKSRFASARRGVLFDSGAFTALNKDGEYKEAPEAFARRAAHWVRRTPRALAVVSQDYMCEPFVLAKTGKTVRDHQQLTIERYDAIVAEWERVFGHPLADGEHGPVAPPIMPVLQGWTADDYVRHVEMYGARLRTGMWVGVGSVCKRQGSINAIEHILTVIKEVRPDLRLHGFRREAHRPSKPSCAAPAGDRRQHGVVVRCPKAGPQRQQHLGSTGLRGARHSASSGARTTAPLRLAA